MSDHDVFCPDAEHPYKIRERCRCCHALEQARGQEKVKYTAWHEALLRDYRKALYHMIENMRTDEINGTSVSQAEVLELIRP